MISVQFCNNQLVAQALVKVKKEFMMDKFVVKRPRDEVDTSMNGPQKKRLKQATIESLKGVVVIEDIQRYKTILKTPDQSAEFLLDTLNELSKKIPSRDVLQSTKIGHTVNRLTKHSDLEVSSKATELVSAWKKHFVEKLDKPMIEVKCDEATERLRSSARSLLSGALQVGDKHSLPDKIEQETFSQCGRLCNKQYKRTLRTLVFTIKHQTDIRNKVLQKDIDVPTLVKDYLKNPQSS